MPRSGAKGVSSPDGSVWAGSSQYNRAECLIRLLVPHTLTQPRGCKSICDSYAPRVDGTYGLLAFTEMHAKIFDGMISARGCMRDTCYLAFLQLVGPLMNKRGAGSQPMPKMPLMRAAPHSYEGRHLLVLR